MSFWSEQLSSPQKKKAARRPPCGYPTMVDLEVVRRAHLEAEEVEVSPHGAHRLVEIGLVIIRRVEIAVLEGHVQGDAL